MPALITPAIRYLKAIGAADAAVYQVIKSG
jgi:hypothetical protein